MGCFTVSKRYLNQTLNGEVKEWLAQKRTDYSGIPTKAPEDDVYPPRFGCSSCEPPLKEACWAGVNVLWCSAESEFVL